MSKTFEEVFGDRIQHILYEAPGDPVDIFAPPVEEPAPEAAPAEEDPLAALNATDEPTAEAPVEEPVADATVPPEEAAPAPATTDVGPMKYEEKVENMMSFLKQFGYAKIEHKIDDAKNSIVVIGTLSDDEIRMLEELANDQKMKVRITKEEAGNSKITKINIENIIDIPTFKALLAADKAKEEANPPA